MYSACLTGDNRIFTADVSQSESVNSVFSEVQKAFNQTPCCVVNCAGVTRDSLLLKMDEKDFDLVMRVNLKVGMIIDQARQK
jgi:NAD(P)-dependent dehydrogenase (short-subunit alcohol dehydrogenase family)